MEMAIVNTNTREYRCEDAMIIRIKAVLVQRKDGKVIGYIAGQGSDDYVANYGNQMSFAEAKSHFPHLTEKGYVVP